MLGWGVVRCVEASQGEAFGEVRGTGVETGARG